MYAIYSTLTNKVIMLSDNNLIALPPDSAWIEGEYAIGDVVHKS